jgi:hypothetical protein
MQVANTNPINPGFSAPAASTSRWALPSEQRLAYREQQLAGVMRSQRRFSGYVAGVASSNPTLPPGVPQARYTNYLGSVSQRAPARPRQPEIGGAAGLPTTRPLANRPPTSRALPQVPSFGSVRYSRPAGVGMPRPAGVPSYAYNRPIPKRGSIRHYR